APEHTQVAAHGGRRQVELPCQVAGPAGPLAQEIDGAPPVGVGQRSQRVVQGGALAAHRPIVVLRPLAASHSSGDMTRTVWPKVHMWPSRSSALYVRSP